MNVTQRAKLIHTFTGAAATAYIYHDAATGARNGWTADKWFLVIVMHDGTKGIRRSTMKREVYETWVNDLKEAA